MTITDTPTEAFTGIRELSTTELIEAEDNPRRDLGDVTELAASIDAVGIIQPIVVTALTDGGEGYLIVAGHRRVAAAIRLGMLTVPCIYRGFTGDAERTEAMLVENLQRVDLSPLDEARGFAQLVDLGHSQRQIAERVGCNQSHVSRRLALTKLPKTVQEWVGSGRMPLRVAEELGDVDDDLVEQLARIPGELGTYDINRARSDLKRLQLQETARATGLPECQSWQGEAVELATDATHWCSSWDSDVGEYVLAFRTLAQTPAAAADGDGEQAAEDPWARQRAEREQQQAELNAHHAAEWSRMVNMPGAQTFAMRYLGQALASDDYGVQLLRAAGDHGLIENVTAATYELALDFVPLAGAEPDDDERRAVAFLTKAGYQPHPTEAERFELPDPGASTSVEEPEAEVGEWQPIDLPPRAEHDQFTMVDIAPDAAEALGPHADVVAAIEEGDTVGDRAEDLYEQAIVGRKVIAGKPDIVQRTPWSGYAAAKETAVIAKIGKLDDLGKVRHVIAYEWAHDKRIAVLEAAVTRHDDLEFEQGTAS